jgi:lytic murein transglycosylase
MRERSALRRRMRHRQASGVCAAALAWLAIVGLIQPAAARQTFDAWRTALWPDARAFGITRQTFDAAFHGLTPDTSLPDLVHSATKQPPKRGQAEFTRPPQAYVNDARIARLAVTGRRLAAKYRAVLDKIEARFGVDRAAILAIWGRETAYGAYQVRHDAIRALATQAYMGRRADMFRLELLHALKMLQDGVVTRENFKASWAGATGLTQFMPSEFDKLAVDIDGDGRRDIWTVPDALASAANQLAAKGWITGRTWGYEVTVPKGVTCAEDGPPRTKAVRAWVARGVTRVAGRKFTRQALGYDTFLFSPGGGMGPTFLVTENFMVFKAYNTSDLYALFVGHLMDRIKGGGPFIAGWERITQLPTRQIAAIQTILQREGYAIAKIDGFIGPNTRSQIGTYQLRHGLTVDCWPSIGLLRTMQRRASSTLR